MKINRDISNHKTDRKTRVAGGRRQEGGGFGDDFQISGLEDGVDEAVSQGFLLELQEANEVEAAQGKGDAEKESAFSLKYAELEMPTGIWTVSSKQFAIEV